MDTPLKRYPIVFWALGLYLCSLGFHFKYDFPLIILAFACVVSVRALPDAPFSKSEWLQYWHLLLFFLLTVIVTLASRDRHHSVMTQLQMLPGFLLYVGIVLSGDNRRTLDAVLLLIVIAAAIAELVFWGQALWLSAIPDRLEKMWEIQSPLLVAANDVLFFSIVAPLAAHLLLQRDARWEIRLFAAIYLLLTLGLVMYMQSRQAVGVYVLGLCVMALLWRPVVGVVVLVCGVLMVIVADAVTGHALADKAVVMFPRRYVWLSAWQMFLDRPWFGQGPGMFKIFYREFLERSGYLLSMVEDRRPMNWAHSLYLEQLAERGLVGFVALMALVGKPLINLFQGLKGMRPGSALYGRALLACWACFLLSGVAETSLLRLWSVCSLFILIGLSVVTNKIDESAQR